MLNRKITPQDKQRQALIDGLHELYGVAPEGYLDPVNGIIGSIPDSKLDEVTLELVQAVQEDAHEATRSNRRQRL